MVLVLCDSRQGGCCDYGCRGRRFGSTRGLEFPKRVVSPGNKVKPQRSLRPQRWRYLRLNCTVTAITTDTARPLITVGSNSHWRTASTAA